MKKENMSGHLTWTSFVQSNQIIIIKKDHNPIVMILNSVFY